MPTLALAVAVLVAAAPYPHPGAYLNADGSGNRATVVYAGGASGVLDASARAGPVPGTNGVFVSPVITKVIDGNATDGIAGYTTWNLTVTLTGNAKSAYTIYGSHDAPMVMPVVFKCNCDPFGSNIGGTNPAFWQYNRNARWDSWMTIGETGGNPHGDISAIGFDFTTWNTTEFDSDDGAVFFMNPDNPNAPSAGTSPSFEAAVAQLTIPTGQDVYASVSLQGRAKQGKDWHVESVIFTSDPAQECHESLKAICGVAKAASPQQCLSCCGKHELEAKSAGCAPKDLGTFCQK